MSWTVELHPRVARALRKMDPPTSKRLRQALRTVAALDDPRTRGKALSGNLAGLWRYRVGDWRIICDVIDNRWVVVVIEIAHRSQVYEN